MGRPEVVKAKTESLRIEASLGQRSQNDGDGSSKVGSVAQTPSTSLAVQVDDGGSGASGTSHRCGRLTGGVARRAGSRSLDVRLAADALAAVGREDAGDVLEEHPAAACGEARLERVEEEPASFSAEPCTASGARQVLTGEAEGCEVGASDVGDGSDIAPNRSGAKAPVFHARCQYPGGRKLPLDVQDWAMRDAKLVESDVEPGVEGAAP